MSMAPSIPAQPRFESGESAAPAELRCLYYMSMMRELEDRIERKLYRQGKIVGGVYVGRGQEAIPVGTALLPDPRTCCCRAHRDQAVFLIRGVPPGRILAQYMGRVGGLTRGRDGNMHMGDMKHGIWSPSSARWRPPCRWPPASPWRCAIAAPTAWPSATSATAPPAAATGTRA
jgi:TPP-dependent pyruvate/acetoin dehydrogenase alpha subunit